MLPPRGQKQVLGGGGDKSHTLQAQSIDIHIAHKQCTCGIQLGGEQLSSDV